MTTYQEVANEAKTQAVQAVDTFFNNVLKGEDQYSCGFAWVTVYPENKGNTKLGKAERRGLESIGFKKDWTGKAWQLWNPGDYAGQNIDCKEEGAQAYAKVMKSHGFKAYAGSRLD
jgi:hypothetical protein